jgi:hypothetical protein
VASLICTRRKKELDHDHLPMQVEIHEEGPREGFQIEPGPISTADKIRLIEAQAETGLGADVVKVEPAPRGDHTRGLGGSGAGFFAAFNRNKRSLGWHGGQNDRQWRRSGPAILPRRCSGSRRQG